MSDNSENKALEGQEEKNRPDRPMAEANPASQKESSFLEGFLDQSPSKNEPENFEEDKALEFKIVDAIQTIYDPEIPVNIYELGLIYGVEIADGGATRVVMTLTTPHCPVAETMPQMVQEKVAGVKGVTSVIVDLVWEPPWDPSMMSEAAQLELGFL